MSMANPSIAPTFPQVPPQKADVRPILPRSENNIWSRVEQRRHEIYQGFSEVLESSKLEGMVLESPPFAVPSWVRVECWIPTNDHNTTKRVWAVVTIHAKSYFEFEMEYDLEYDRVGRHKKFTRVVPFGKDKAGEIVSFLLADSGGKPDVSEFRKQSWQMWRPKNKLQHFGRDWLVMGAGILFALGVFGLFGASVDPSYVLAGAALLVLGVILAVVAARRKTVWRTEGRPEAEPRNLVRVDSWQTTIFGIGEQADTLKNQFLVKLKSPPVESFRYRVENLWYWGLDGKEEREQIVLTSGRGTVFCQIYKYGKDLYVGWDGHLNAGQWVEKVIGSGIDKAAGCPVKVTSVTPGVQRLTEYDLVDLSCLMEWTHAQLVRLCKDMMQEHKIDQEVDFSIMRGDRQGITGGDDIKKKEKKERKPLFQRTA